MTEKDFNSTDRYNEDLQDEFKLAKHSVKHKQIERKIRKKRKKVNRIKSFLRFVLFVVLVFLAYEFVKLPQWYLPQDAFVKKDGRVVEVINNHIVPTPVIYEALRGIYVPKLPIFLMKVKPIKQELFKIPVIKNLSLIHI